MQAIQPTLAKVVPRRIFVRKLGESYLPGELCHSRLGYWHFQCCCLKARHEADSEMLEPLLCVACSGSISGEAEGERERLRNQLKAKATKADNLAVLLPNLQERFVAVMSKLTTLVRGPRTRDARETLQMLLGRDIILHPSANGSERFLTAEVSGDYSGILRLCSVNKDGGGHGS